MTDRFIGAHTIFDDAGKSRTPYMRRYWIGRLRLHIFYRGDNDPDHHDHPWDFWTFPLTSYVEEVAEPIWMSGPLPMQYHPRRQVVRAFRLHYRPATHCHRVLGRYSTPIALYDGKERNPRFDQGRIITLVWRGRSGRAWGFLRNRNGQWCWTPWRDYVFGGGKHAPCEQHHDDLTKAKR